jgi:DNA-binding beta-propeller fold protein YncE
MMRKSVYLATIIIAVIGGFFLSQYYLDYRERSPNSNQGDTKEELPRPKDAKTELLRALEDVGNHTLAYLPNARSGLLMVVDMDSGLLLGSVKLGEFLNGPYSILFTPDKDQFLCYFPRLGVVRVYDSHTFDNVGSFKAAGSYIIGDDDYAYSFGSSRISVIDFSEMKVVETIRPEEAALDGVVSSDGFIYFSGDHGITKLDPSDLSAETVVSIGSKVSRIAVSNDGSKLFLAFCKTYGSTWNLNIYDTASWEEIQVISDITERPAPDGAADDMVVTPDDSLVYSDSDTDSLYILNTTTFELVRTVPAEIPGFIYGPQGIFITPDGKYICTLSPGGTPIHGGPDPPCGLLVMDMEYNRIHEISLGDYATIEFLAFKEP